MPIRNSSGAWTYFFGAGHYVRGDFLHYFQTHGGLETLGYPRTEAVIDGGRTVQYFQGGELVGDAHGNGVGPVALPPSPKLHVNVTGPSASDDADPSNEHARFVQLGTAITAFGTASRRASTMSSHVKVVGALVAEPEM